MKRKNHKFLVALLCFAFVPVFGFSEVVNSMQLFKADSWVYDAIEKLETESGKINVSSLAPLTAGELRLYFDEIEREKLSESGKELYDTLEDYLYSKPVRTFGFEDFVFAPNAKLNPEFYVKTNPEIDWTHNYFYKDRLLIASLRMGFSDYFLFDVEPFVAKNHYAMHESRNFCNIPFAVGESEFQYPRWANFSAGYNFKTWGFNFIIGKEGVQIGQTLTGSIIWNNTFMTDMFAQFNIYSRMFKYSMTVSEVSVNKFFYHNIFEVRPFKNVRVAVGEGVLVTGSFEIRFLIPLMPKHSFAGWLEYDEVARKFYSESNFCDYFNCMLEFTFFPTTKFYIYYTMNEFTLPWEGKDSPNSIGWQLGSKSSFNAPDNGFWNLDVEGVWTMPYLYIKHAPQWSLYREQNPNQEGGQVYSWIGTPFGPDCMAGAVRFGYEKPQKWSADFIYVFSAHGENGFAMFYDEKNKNADGFYTYYPEVRYDHATTEEEQDKALSDALNLLPSGTVEYKSQIALKGDYIFNRHFAVAGKIVYIFAFNHNNIKGNFQQGAEFTISGSYTLF